MISHPDEGPRTAVVLAGGDPPSPAVLGEIPTEALVVAADSGLDHAQAIGLEVDLVVGDFDSVSPEALARAEGIPFERHPTDKDRTDLELALDSVARLEVDRVIVVGGHGGRLDHFVANLCLIASPAYRHLDLEWLAGRDRIHVIRSATELHGAPGDLVTLLAWEGPAGGVQTHGLRWVLDGERLEPGSTRGVSNLMARPVATVGLVSGTLLAIQPGAIDP
ncbi:MAG: thiamine diphosphokinase [Acidimicrobiia bacterium]